MCKAYVLRFSCAHAVLMSIEPCQLAPCPTIKTTGKNLNQQPFRCYNCQHKLSASTYPPQLTRQTSSTSSTGSLHSVIFHSSSTGRHSTPSTKPISYLLPGVARQPANSVKYCHNYTKPSNLLAKPFTFTCSTSNHYPTPHYSSLPHFLPHQDHPCPPCQLEHLRQNADQEAARAATAQYPHLTGEMMIRNGRRQREWEGKVTLGDYVDEKRQDEREMWLHVSRKWTQDLRRARVLVAEEDGLGLLG